MITAKELKALGLQAAEPKYYKINDEVTVDLEGNIRLENELTEGPVLIAQAVTVDQLKAFIDCVNH
jgi:hypothetical protein